MERLKIIKELNNVANILEGNGRISEASQITNVLIKIAQQTESGNGSTVQPTQPTPGQPAAQNQTQLTPEQIAANKEKAIQSNKNYLNEMLKLREIAQYFLNQNRRTEYTYDSRGYVIKIDDTIFIKPKIEDLVAEINSAKKTNISVPGQPAPNKFLDEIATNIASAAYWPDPEGDSSITKAINDKYLLGYNLLGGTYYIQNKTTPSDVYDNKDINVLKDIFGKLGKFYKDTNKTFPESIFEYNTTSKKKDGDINVIILEALKKDLGDKWAYINNNFSNHPNIKDIQRGFVQEYNRRDPIKQISLDNPTSLNQA
jgi:YD repeat-containing protein